MNRIFLSLFKWGKKNELNKDADSIYSYSISYAFELIPPKNSNYVISCEE
jgi:hypothetical protein